MRGPHEAGSDPVPHCGGSLTSPPSCRSSAHTGGQPTVGLGSPSQNRPAEGRPVPKRALAEALCPAPGSARRRTAAPGGARRQGPADAPLPGLLLGFRAAAQDPRLLAAPSPSDSSQAAAGRTSGTAPRRRQCLLLLSSTRFTHLVCSQDRKRARGVRVQYCFLTSSVHPPPPPGCSQRAS